ncbi:MAG: hypothetical protein ACRENE_04955, partial [Polyangiaceae bacterium]
MAGIPQVRDSDVEDVIWALQTADALWKRGERADAVVWLRRAAQSAGEAEDDDRALALAREAAELAEWVASQDAHPTLGTPRSAPPPSAPTAGEAVDEFLRSSGSLAGGAPAPPVPASGGAPAAPEGVGSMEAEMPVDVALESLVPRPVPTPVVTPAEVEAPPEAPPEPPRRRTPPPPKPQVAPSSVRFPASESGSGPKIQRVPSAAEVHAGILDPWAEAEAPKRAAALPPEPHAAPPHAPAPLP